MLRSVKKELHIFEDVNELMANYLVTYWCVFCTNTFLRINYNLLTILYYIIGKCIIFFFVFMNHIYLLCHSYLFNIPKQIKMLIHKMRVWEIRKKNSHHATVEIRSTFSVLKQKRSQKNRLGKVKIILIRRLSFARRVGNENSRQI